jgi:hypothetical protein
MWDHDEAARGGATGSTLACAADGSGRSDDLQMKAVRSSATSTVAETRNPISKGAR